MQGLLSGAGTLQPLNVVQSDKHTTGSGRSYDGVPKRANRFTTAIFEAHNSPRVSPIDGSERTVRTC